MSTTPVIVRGRAEAFRQAIVVGPHELVSDEPRGAGGEDAGPDPYDLLAAALGSCTSMTIGLVARRRGWPLEAVEVRVRHRKVHAVDCAECQERDAKIDRLERTISLLGPLTDEQRQALVDVAGRCPVQRTLQSRIEIVTELAFP